MFTRVEACVWAPLAVLALWAALLAASPAVAEARGLGPANDRPGTNPAAGAAVTADRTGNPERTTNGPRVKRDRPYAGSIVVRPGDSLWSIGEDRLGPEATAGQISDWVGRAYRLNRHRIGADPDLILPNQRLLAPEAPRAAARAPAPASSRAPARAAAPEQDPKSSRNPESLSLPGLPENGAAPGAGSIFPKQTSASGDTRLPGGVPVAVTDRVLAGTGLRPTVRHDGRRLLGLGCFAIAFGAAAGLGAFAARPLRERRRAGGRALRRGHGERRVPVNPLTDLGPWPEPAEGKPAAARHEATGAKEPVVDESPTRTTRPAGRGQGGR